MKAGDLADRPEQADGGANRGEAEQERHAGGDDRAEGEQQDDQRGTEGELHGLRLVGGLLLGEGVTLGGAAVLLDAQLGMRLLDGGDGGERSLGHLDQLRVVLVGVGEAEVDDHGAAVLGDGVGAVGLVQRAVDVGDAVDRVEPLYGVLDGRGDLRIVGLDRALALD
jgi:hypothetical protein